MGLREYPSCFVSCGQNQSSMSRIPYIFSLSYHSFSDDTFYSQAYSQTTVLALSVLHLKVYHPINSSISMTMHPSLPCPPPGAIIFSEVSTNLRVLNRNPSSSSFLVKRKSCESWGNKTFAHRYYNRGNIQ